jgi:hypothetical protein
MRIIIFSGFSLFVHAMMIAYLQLPPNLVPVFQYKALQVMMVAKKHNKPVSGTIVTSEPAKPIVAIPQNVLHQNMLATKPMQPDAAFGNAIALELPHEGDDVQSITVNNLPKMDSEVEPAAIDTSNYYASTSVDRKALPQMNIDKSMLSATDYSGLPIKLRLFVNTYGRVVKIERIGVLDQDIAYVEQLENLLYKVTFLPAKREGLDVDSYQDLLLSFNPLPMINNSKDLH